jgi:hypothetical protein
MRAFLSYLSGGHQKLRVDSFQPACDVAPRSALQAENIKTRLQITAAEEFVGEQRAILNLITHEVTRAAEMLGVDSIAANSKNVDVLQFAVLYAACGARVVGD